MNGFHFEYLNRPVKKAGKQGAVGGGVFPLPWRVLRLTGDCGEDGVTSWCCCGLNNRLEPQIYGTTQADGYNGNRIDKMMRNPKNNLTPVIRSDWKQAQKKQGTN